jgi:TonB family protein
MARRRRAKNNLLAKMIAIAVLINAILLPILATLGVFKPKKGINLMSMKLIKLPPLEKRKVAMKKNPPKKQVARAHPHTPGHASERHGPVRVVQNQPHVALSTSTTNGTEGVAQGTEKMGTQATAPTQPATQPPPPVQPQPQPPPVQPQPTPTPPAPPAPTPPHVPVYVEATPLDEPQPSIPDDLKDQELHAVFTGLFSIDVDGSTQVSMVKSTGSSELDDLAMQAARKWTFKPGMRDGVPVKSYRRLEIYFDVS